MAVVVRRAEPAVDLRGREDEPAPTRERDDLVHRDLGRMRQRYPRPRGGEGHTGDRRRRPRGHPFRVHEYEHDPRAESFGLEAVEKLGLDPARVFKTLVADVDGTLTVAVVPVEAQLDLRALGSGRAWRTRRRRSARPGYVTGGISPLGQRRPLPTVVDESALAFETIHVSAGRRGLELELAPADLVAAHRRQRRRR